MTTLRRKESLIAPPKMLEESGRGEVEKSKKKEYKGEREIKMGQKFHDARRARRRWQGQTTRRPEFDGYGNGWGIKEQRRKRDDESNAWEKGECTSCTFYRKLKAKELQRKKSERNDKCDKRCNNASQTTQARPFNCFYRNSVWEREKESVVDSL